MKFQDVLQNLGIHYQESGDKHCQPGWVQINCPYCNGENHLGYKLEGGYFNCWSCGSKPLIQTLMDISRLNYHEVKELLQDVDNVFLKESTKKKYDLELPGEIGPLQLAHWEYLRGRGFDPANIAKLWGVQGIGIAAKLQWRLFIPVYFQGEIVSWTTRSISDKNKARYISARKDQEKISHKSLLYGEDLARNGIVIVEGPIDAWRIGPGAVATCGLVYSKAQILRMVKYATRCVCFDAEPAAQRRAKELADILQSYPGETCIAVLDSGDPGEASPKDVKTLRKHFLE